MENIDDLINSYKVDTREIIENFLAHYKLNNPQQKQRNIDTAKSYLDGNFENYKSMIVRSGVELMHQASFVMQFEDMMRFQQQTADSVGELFGVIMNTSQN